MSKMKGDFNGIMAGGHEEEEDFWFDWKADLEHQANGFKEPSEDSGDLDFEAFNYNELEIVSDPDTLSSVRRQLFECGEAEEVVKTNDDCLRSQRPFKKKVKCQFCQLKLTSNSQLKDHFNNLHYFEIMSIIQGDQREKNPSTTIDDNVIKALGLQGIDNVGPKEFFDKLEARSRSPGSTGESPSACSSSSSIASQSPPAATADDSPTTAASRRVCPTPTYYPPPPEIITQSQIRQGIDFAKHKVQKFTAIQQQKQQLYVRPGTKDDLLLRPHPPHLRHIPVILPNLKRMNRLERRRLPPPLSSIKLSTINTFSSSSSSLSLIHI